VRLLASGHRLLEQLGGPAVDRQFGLQLGDASTCSYQFSLICGADPRYLAGVDTFLPTPVVDRLIADLKITDQLGDRAAGFEQIEDLAAAIVDPDTTMVADLRVRLWREHFRPPGTPAAEERLRNLDISLGYFRESWGIGTALEVPGTKLVEILP
jgi:hypothetical protein